MTRNPFDIDLETCGLFLALQFIPKKYCFIYFYATSDKANTLNICLLISVLVS